MGASRRPQFLDGPRPLAFLHRAGMSANENSLAALTRAADMGYTYIETDVRATSDGVAVLVHDAKLMDGEPRSLVRNVTYAGITHHPPPRLDDVLGSWPQLQFSIDVKSWNAVEPVRRALRQTRAYDRVCLTSFDDLRTRYAARGLPTVCTGAGTLGGMALLSATALDLRTVWPRLPFRPSIIQLPLRAGRWAAPIERLVEQGRKRGVDVHFWTANDEATVRRLVAAGADGIISDDAVLLKRVLQEEKLWDA